MSKTCLCCLDVVIEDEGEDWCRCLEGECSNCNGKCSECMNGHVFMWSWSGQPESLGPCPHCNGTGRKQSE